MSKISFILKRFRRSKHLRLRVKQDGTVLVTAPMRVSKRWIDGFVEKSREWVDEQIERVERSLRLSDRKITSLSDGKKLYREHRQQALALVNQRLEYWNERYCFSWKKVGVRNQSTRWGSCSRRGNLSFNYRVVFLPRELVDYLVVHELCHLKEMNHSVRFWALVGKAIPDFRERRRELKRRDLAHHRNVGDDENIDEKKWSVYMLRCGDGTLYTGIALNVEERLQKHNEGKGAKYTRGRGPCVVVWRSEMLNEGDARRMEIGVKKMTRREKELFISSTK